jgi:HEAT repeat protein
VSRIDELIAKLDPDIETGFQDPFVTDSNRAAEELAKMGDAAVEPLMKALPRTSYAHIILGVIGGERAFEALLEELGSDDFRRVAAAADALGKIGDPRALERLRPFLQTNIAEVYQAVSKAIAVIEREGAGDRWHLVNRDQPYEQVRPMSAQMKELIRDPALRQRAIEWHRQFVAAMPELEFESDDKRARAWSMLGSLIYYLLNPDEMNMMRPCPEAAHCFEQAVKVAPDNQYFRQLLGYVT